MTEFEPRTSDIGSDRSTNWATQPLPKYGIVYDLSQAVLPSFYCIVWPDYKSFVFYRQMVNYKLISLPQSLI